MKKEPERKHKTVNKSSPLIVFKFKKYKLNFIMQIAVWEKTYHRYPPYCAQK